MVRSAPDLGQCQVARVQSIKLDSLSPYRKVREGLADVISICLFNLQPQKTVPVLQGCIGKGGGLPPDVTLLQKNVEKQERENSFQVISMQLYIQKLKLKSVQIYEFCCHYVQQTHWLHCT